MRRLVVVATVVACLATLTGGVASAKAPTSPVSPVAASTSSGKLSTAEDDPRTTARAYRVGRGITFNSPLGSRSRKFAILRKIHAAIKNTPSGETIRVMSWNIMYMSSVDVLLDAQRRGVKLWILMDEENYSAEVPNRPWRALKSGIAANNRKIKKASKRSRAKVCNNACRRGATGAAHAKYFMFTKVGASEHVVIQGGTNLTLASATNQWNEVYTWADDYGVYKFTYGIFREMWADRTPDRPWAEYAGPGGKYRFYFSPQRGNYDAGDDPLEWYLARTRCRGATGASGDGANRTIIRAAPDVIRGKRGMRVARLIRKRWLEGCNVRIGYTVMGKDIYRYLKKSSPRGPVPIRHLVQDFNGDKEFDRYFHLKVWTINGVVNGNTEVYFAMNGSSNISDYSSASDENIGVFRTRPQVMKYQEHIDYWYRNPPKSRPVVRSLIDGPVDPYRNVDMD
ncbi:phospholipase D-like domain-containing protein [Nocardioides sp. SYSU DS0651]|uniref:phospholipase D-like domain-containing protein n=1 Tax=Nocardioides sp. SYSU DS0651 TaxID=3415955 RepID=UPI003F4C4316